MTSRILVLNVLLYWIMCGYFSVMQTDGWIVNTISLLNNPNQVRPSRFWGVYTKLKIFNMTNYKKGGYSMQ